MKNEGMRSIIGVPTDVSSEGRGKIYFIHRIIVLFGYASFISVPKKK
jgi:hypothetical protein